MPIDLGRPVRIIATGEVGAVFRRLDLGSPDERYVVRVWRGTGQHNGMADVEVKRSELEPV